MTEIEQCTFRDGFRVALVGTDADPATGCWGYAWRLYDGGRCVDAVERRASYYATPAGFIHAFRSLLLRVSAPPHVLVLLGRGRHELVLQSLAPAIIAELRILDLLGSALALSPMPPAKRTMGACLTAYGIAGVQEDDVLLDDRHEALLWQVVARAGETGLDWPGLLDLPERGVPAVSFDDYAFDETAITALPPRPGVYTMLDRAGGVLYVGKSGNLARRLADYFRAVRDPSDKIAQIRDRIHRFTIEEVGSELEALLLENRRIEEWGPALNVQLKVAEGRGRYGSPAGPILLVLPSRKTGAVELFFFGGPEPRAIQVRVNPAKPPRPTLAAVCGWYNGSKPTLRRTRAVHDWGVTGSAICDRFFGAHASRLHWCELPPGDAGDAYLTPLLAMIRRAVESGFDPAEVRF